MHNLLATWYKLWQPASTNSAKLLLRRSCALCVVPFALCTKGDHPDVFPFVLIIMLALQQQLSARDVVHARPAHLHGMVWCATMAMAWTRNVSGREPTD
mmetsp:Transcript_6573/g.17031  ORF Transcript_6573/g.17031 Transcript_6573/m.17031 type:complete len:99 (+) Transcript_6573:1237-1533(+)